MVRRSWVAEDAGSKEGIALKLIFEISRNLQFVLFVLVAVLSLLRWHQGRSPAQAWVAATFGSIGGVVLVARFLSPDPTGTWGDTYARKALVAILILFPYFLFRFTASLRPHPRWYHRAAMAATAAVGLSIFLFRTIPARGAPQPPGWQAYLLLLTAQWVVLSTVSAVVLWRGGDGQPTVARRRMRFLSLGAFGMALALIVGVAAPGAEITVARLVGQFLGLLSIPMFLIGVAPPSALLAVWRRPELRALQAAERGLMTAEAPEQVAAAILQHATNVVGGRAAILVVSQAVVGAFRLTDDELVGAMRAEEPTSEGPDTTIRIEMRDGFLAVFAGPFTPYFGRDETDLLAGLGAMADLALERTRALVREREHAESLREFVAIASHDLRTPLTVIKGFTALMDERWASLPDADKKGYVTRIDRQADQLSRLVDDLLTISRIEGRALKSRPEPVSVACAVEDAIEGNVEARHGVRVDVADDLGVTADPTHVQRILRNMIANAIAYGVPPVEIDACRVPGGVEIRVSDHGPGVPDAFVPQLFEKFARLDKKLSTATKGTGLGLYIVRGLARAAGGDAWYEPTGSAGGACFAVRLPAARVEATDHGSVDARKAVG